MISFDSKFEMKLSCSQSEIRRDREEVGGISEDVGVERGGLVALAQLREIRVSTGSGSCTANLGYTQNSQSIHSQKRDMWV